MSLSSQERDNLIRWDGTRKGFYEVYYLKWNDFAGKNAVWLRYTLTSPLIGPPKAEVWGVFFDAVNPKNNVAFKNSFSVRESRQERDFFYFSAGPSAIFDGGARGLLTGSSGKLSWEIKWEPGLSLHHFPAPLYLGGLPRTKFLAPYLSTRLSGELQLNDRKFNLQGVPAHQAHLWGTEYASSWVWGNCNTFEEDPDFCFEGLSAQIEFNERPVPPLTLLFFNWEEVFYRFNSPLHWFKNKSNHELDRWQFEASSKNIRFIGHLFTDPADMVVLRYEDPQGGERFCHNTKIADLKIEVLRKKKSGWEYIKTFHANRSAAFEVVQKSLDPRVPLLIP